MLETAQQLESIINEYSVRFSELTEEELSSKPAPGKWSKKEIIGHLVDSAQNNIRRFVVTQYETTPHIVYAQNEWVEIQQYQQYNSKDLVALWVLINKHIVLLLENLPAEKLALQCDTGKNEAALHTIEFLAKDYITHHLHHLKQIIPA